MDTPKFVVKATDLLVVRCVNPDVKGGEKTDGLTLIEVEVLVGSKGGTKVGKAELATIGQRMEKGQRYLLASFGGSAFDTGFLAQSDQAVVELPPDFDLKSPDFVTDKLQYRVQKNLRRSTGPGEPTDFSATPAGESRVGSDRRAPRGTEKLIMP